MEMLGRVGESIISKVGGKLVEYAQQVIVTARRPDKFTIETLGRNLKSLSAKASDVKEEIKKAELLGRKKRKREVENWLTEVQKLETEFVEWGGDEESEGFISRFLGGDRVKQLKERVDGLIEQSKHFGGLLLDVHETGGVALLTRSMVGKEFQKAFEKIWKFLVVDKVSSVGIYGMGGVGKTTLAKHINNRLVKDTQEYVFWVTVSQMPSITRLQDDIARVIGISDLSEEPDEDKRAARLNQELSKRKNFVLILDDVWNNIHLEKVGDPLSIVGCRLIITSRSLELCRQIGCKEIIPVKVLDENDAWKLFGETLGGEPTLISPIKEVAKSIATKCSGLPLAITVTAGSLRGETEICAWRNMLCKLKTPTMGDEDDEDTIFNVLRCSFDRLDRREEDKRTGHTKLQLCFLYCCLYPEDYPICREELINKFISEEMLDQKGSRKRQLDEGHCILKKLVDVCLLESPRNYFDGYLKMHDLVRDMALKITKGKYEAICENSSLKEIPDEERYWTKNLEKMSLMNDDICKIPDGMSPNCPKLSTLLLSRNRDLQVIPSSFFSQMYGLCTLDLCGCGRLESVPYIGNLTALRELNLSWTGIVEVPQGMEKLVNLRCLKMRRVNLKKLPSGLLLKFPKLQYLCLPYQIQAPVEEIERLEWLEVFEGRVKDLCDFNRLYKCLQSMGGSGLSRAVVGNDLPEFIHAPGELGELVMHGTVLEKEEWNDAVMLAVQDIQRLTFVECKGMSNCLLDDFASFNINPKSLRTLSIQNCRGVECILKREQVLMAKEESEYLSFQMLEEIRLVLLPDFVGAMMFQTPASPPPTQVVFSSLKRLSITNCHKMNLGIPASELQNLEQLEVWSCEGIEEIIQVVEGEGDEAAVASLPNLSIIMLSNLPRLKSICSCATMVGSSASPSHPPARVVISSLKHLSIGSCGKMKTLGLPASELQSLENLRVFGCEEMEEIIEVVAAGEEGRGGEQGDQPACVFLPRLKILSLTDLPRLKSICGGTMVCDSIGRIHIRGCPSLKRLRLYFPAGSGDDEIIGQPCAYSTPPTLQQIRIATEESEWWESLEWEHPSHKHLLQPLLIEEVTSYM